METVLVTAGIACLVGAIVGGGLKAANMEIPHLESVRRQVLLAALGAVLLAVGIFGPKEFKAARPDDPQVDNQAPSSDNGVSPDNGVVTAGDRSAPADNASVTDGRSAPADNAVMDGDSSATPAGVDNIADTKTDNLNDAQFASISGPFRNATQEAQALLQVLGYDIRYADGFEGPRTTVALEDFQRKHQIPVSGAADAATLEVLRARARKSFLRPTPATKE
jgi:Putative peptidoglycan binding domain